MNKSLIGPRIAALLLLVGGLLLANQFSRDLNEVTHKAGNEPQHEVGEIHLAQAYPESTWQPGRLASNTDLGATSMRRVHGALPGTQAGANGLDDLKTSVPQNTPMPAWVRSQTTIDHLRRRGVASQAAPEPPARMPLAQRIDNESPVAGPTDSQRSSAASQPRSWEYRASPWENQDAQATPLEHASERKQLASKIWPDEQIGQFFPKEPLQHVQPKLPQPTRALVGNRQLAGASTKGSDSTEDTLPAPAHTSPNAAPATGQARERRFVYQPGYRPGN